VSDIDPAFALPGFRGLDLPAPWRTARSAEWYAHRVAREPRDLLAHVQRIGLLAGLGDGAGTCGALRDLGLALDGAGRGLRDRLLARCGSALEPACRDAFAGGAAGHRHGLCVLDEAVDGRRDLVTATAETPGQADPVKLAEAELALGNLAGSRELLEAAIADPAMAGRARALLASIERAMGG
jgi:hypothetical protein